MWPGSGKVNLGYGTIGGILWDSKGTEIRARQQVVPRLWSTGITELCEPVCPPYAGHSSNERRTIANNVLDLNSGNVDEELLADLGYESQCILSPAADDPLMGCRIARWNGNNGVVAADDTYLRFVVDDRLSHTLNVSSPVLQVERSGRLVRTFRDTLHLHESSKNASVVASGPAMDVSLDQVSNAACVLDSQAELSIYDISSETRTSSRQMTRSTISGWGRIEYVEGNPSLVNWCDRYEMGILDFREKPEAAGACHKIIEIADRASEIHDMVAGTRSTHDMWLLTDGQLQWIDLRMNSVVLTQEHTLSSRDTSAKLNTCLYKDTEILTISSALQPLTMFYSFGRVKHDLPASMQDPYFVETWPSIIPQSNLMVQNNDQELVLYTVGNSGGVYRQSLSCSKDDEKITFPVADPPVKENFASNRLDWDLSCPAPMAWVANFENLYKYIFEMKRPPLIRQIPNSTQTDRDEAMKAMGFQSEKEAEVYLRDMWVTPLIEQRGFKESEIRSRIEAVDHILADLRTVENPRLSMTLPIIDDQNLDKTTNDILSSWPVADSNDIQLGPQSVPVAEAEESIAETQPDIPMTQPPMTQPMATPAGPSISLDGWDAGSIAFSQPLPAVDSAGTGPRPPKKHKSHKSSHKAHKSHSKKKRNDGFS